MSDVKKLLDCVDDLESMLATACRYIIRTSVALPGDADLQNWWDEYQQRDDETLPSVLVTAFKHDTSTLESTKGTTRTERLIEMLKSKGTGKTIAPWRVVNTETNEVVTTDTKAVCKEAAYKLNTSRLGDKQDICYLAERIPTIPDPLDKDGASFTLTTYEEGERFVVISEIAAMKVVTEIHDRVLGITERQTAVVTKAGVQIRFSESAYDLLRTSIQKGTTA